MGIHQQSCQVAAFLLAQIKFRCRLQAVVLLLFFFFYLELKFVHNGKGNSVCIFSSSSSCYRAVHHKILFVNNQMNFLYFLVTSAHMQKTPFEFGYKVLYGNLLNHKVGSLFTMRRYMARRYVKPPLQQRASKKKLCFIFFWFIFKGFIFFPLQIGKFLELFLFFLSCKEFGS